MHALQYMTLTKIKVRPVAEAIVTTGNLVKIWSKMESKLVKRFI